MTVPEFTYDAEACAYISEPLTIVEQCLAHIELAERAPVVILKQEDDGGFAKPNVSHDHDSLVHAGV